MIHDTTHNGCSCSLGFTFSIIDTILLRTVRHMEFEKKNRFCNKNIYINEYLKITSPVSLIAYGHWEYRFIESENNCE